MPNKVLVIPSRCNGSVARVVSDGTVGWVEVWEGPTEGWKRNEKYHIDEVIKAPPASDELLKKLGVT